MTKNNASMRNNLNLIRRAKEEDNKAKEKLINSYKKFISFLAKKYSVGNLSVIDDLQQEGYLGLLKAVKNFNFDLDKKFSSYAEIIIRSYMLIYVTEKAKIIHMPRYMVTEVTKFKRLYQRLDMTLKRNPTLEELSNHLNLNIKKIEELQNIATRKFLYFDYYDDENTSVYSTKDQLILDCINLDQFALDNKELEDILTYKKYKSNLKNILSKLDLRSRKILKLRYGIDTKFNKAWTLQEIGDKMKISRERVRQIVNESLLEINQNIKKEERFFLENN